MKWIENGRNMMMHYNTIVRCVSEKSMGLQGSVMFGVKLRFGFKQGIYFPPTYKMG